MPRWIEVALWVIAGWVLLLVAFFGLLALAFLIGPFGLVLGVTMVFLTYVLWTLVDTIIP